jgi:putative two-component system response regulator
MRMAHYSRLIAAGLKLPVQEQELIFEAAPMHDLGKVGTRDEILLKPGRLTEDEFEIMKAHATIGYQILLGSSSPKLQAAAVIACSHHEKFDGSGYPKGLAGNDIPLYGRIVALADVFDALTSCRPYKKAWDLSRAAAYIREQSGSHFDPACVKAFFEAWDQVLAIRENYGDKEE